MPCSSAEQQHLCLGAAKRTDSLAVNIGCDDGIKPSSEPQQAVAARGSSKRSLPVSPADAPLRLLDVLDPSAYALVAKKRPRNDDSEGASQQLATSEEQLQEQVDRIVSGAACIDQLDYLEKLWAAAVDRKRSHLHNGDAEGVQRAVPDSLGIDALRLALMDVSAYDQLLILSGCINDACNGEYRRLVDGTYVKSDDKTLTLQHSDAPEGWMLKQTYEDKRAINLLWCACPEACFEAGHKLDFDAIWQIAGYDKNGAWTWVPAALVRADLVGVKRDFLFRSLVVSGGRNSLLNGLYSPTPSMNAEFDIVVYDKQPTAGDALVRSVRIQKHGPDFQITALLWPGTSEELTAGSELPYAISILAETIRKPSMTSRTMQKHPSLVGAFQELAS